MKPIRALFWLITGLLGGAGATAWLLRQESPPGTGPAPGGRMPLESVSPPVVPVPLPSQRMKQVDIPEDMPYDPAVGTSMGQAETSTPASVPASAPAGTVSLGMSDAGDLEEWKRLAKDVQAQLQEADGALAGLRGELAAVKGWQAKTPSLVRLGQSLATLPPHKVAAADAAIGAGCFPTVSADCQDLSIIDGIGETYEQRLYAAGIGTFWELAYLSDTALKEILRLSDWQMRSIDFADIRLQAQQLAIDTNAKGLLWDGETPDDFARIKGIGKVYEQRLYERGILTYRALATEKVETLNAILGPQVFPAQIEQWIRQAAALAAEQET